MSKGIDIGAEFRDLEFTELGCNIHRVDSDKVDYVIMVKRG